MKKHYSAAVFLLLFARANNLNCVSANPYPAGVVRIYHDVLRTWVMVKHFIYLFYK